MCFESFTVLLEAFVAVFVEGASILLVHFLWVNYVHSSHR